MQFVVYSNYEILLLFNLFPINTLTTVCYAEYNAADFRAA